MSNLYLEDFNELLGDVIKGFDFEENVPKLVYYGVKYINDSSNRPDTPLEMGQRLDFIKLIINLICQSSLDDLIDIFPIEDRSSTEAKWFPEPWVIGVKLEEYRTSFTSDPFNTLWGIGNKDITNFFVNIDSSIVSSMIMNNIKDEPIIYKNKFIEEQTLKNSRFYRTPDGKAYLINDEGRKLELKRQYPGYLRTIK